MNQRHIAPKSDNVEIGKSFQSQGLAHGALLGIAGSVGAFQKTVDSVAVRVGLPESFRTRPDFLMTSVDRKENKGSIVTAFIAVSGYMIDLLEHIVPRHTVQIVDALITLFITLIELIDNIAVFFRAIEKILT